MMKACLKKFAVWAFALCLVQGVSAQEGRKSVTLKITTETNGQRTVIDTSFQVTSEDEIDAVLEKLGVATPQPNQSIEKQIIIRETERDSGPGSFEFHFATPGLRAILGVYPDDDEAEGGVRIGSVSPNSGAQVAGLRKGDILTEVAGEEVNESDDIGKALKSFQPGDEVEVVYLRDGQVNSTTVKLKPGSAFPAPAPEGQHNFNYNYNFNFDDGKGISWNSNQAFLGIYPEQVDEEAAKKNGMEEAMGIYVNKVVGDAAAAKAGLQAGDIITHLNGEQVEGPKDLTRVLKDQKPGDALEIRYLRAGKPASTTATLDKRKQENNVPFAPQAGARAYSGSMKEVKKAYLGVYLENEENGGVRITKVSPNTAASDAGLEPGDVIIGMNDLEIDTYRDLTEAMQALEPGAEVRIKFARNGKEQRKRVVLGEKVVKVWGSASADGVDKDVDIKIVILNFDDAKAGENLRRFMESPSLDVNGFTYFPNPNEGRFRLQFELPGDGDLKIRIYSPEGKVLYEEFRQGFSGAYDQQIDISEFVSQGIYFLQVEQNGKGMAAKIIVR